MKTTTFARLGGALLAVLAVGCTVDDVGVGDAQHLTEAQRQCLERVPRGEPMDAPATGLVATGDVPLPSLGPDAEGYFHPPHGYVEGGTFAVAEDRDVWRVPAEEVAPTAPIDGLRVVEWNVERGQSLDKAIRLMKRVNADVWVLNETDLYGTPSGGVVVAREIARALGYSYVTATEFVELRADRRGSSGDAIVSRYPIRTATRIDTPIFEQHGGYDWANSKGEPRCGQRSALRAVVEVPTERGTLEVPVVALHLENKANSDVRKRQFEAVVDALVVPGEATVVAGDLNTISPFEGRRFRSYLDERMRDRGPGDAFIDCSHGDDTATFSAAVVVNMRIDWMLLQPGDDGVLDCPRGRLRRAPQRPRERPQAGADRPRAAGERSAATLSAWSFSSSGVGPGRVAASL